MAENVKIDAITGTATTGHDWDGISELNTPLPRWWLWTFYATIVWAAGYWVVYPAWPLISSHTTGVIGYSSRADVAREVAALEAFRDKQAAGLKDASLEDIKTKPELPRLAMARGKAAFGDDCVPCHNQGGVGSTGYPNLTDDDWIWGGKLGDIQQTINHGIRWEQNNETRVGQMLAFQKTGVLKANEVATVVEYVRSIGKLDVTSGADLAKGQTIFAENCAACHGEAGKGNPELGAPDLTDAIWLYGTARESMIETVANGRGGIMPAWIARLDPITVKSLTVYVHSLGGGQ